jgi:NADPH2:quinone reductase
MTDTMKAMIADEPGPPENLELRTVPIPEPGPGQVRLRVAYAALNPLDTHARAARVAYMAPEFPFTPGIEFSGLVEAIGEGVDVSWLGKRVVSEKHWGGCAEYATTPVDNLLPIPEGFDWTLGTVFHTCVYSAWHVLHTAGRVRSTDVVLLHSAAGAIGAMSSQIAKTAGATVIGLCSPAKFDFARAHGADHLFSSSDPDWPTRALEATGGHGADLVIDGIAGPEAPKNFEAAAPFGQVIYMGAVGGYAPPVDISRELYAKSIAVRGFMVYLGMAVTGGAELGLIHDALRTGRWKAPISEIVELEATPELHRRFEARELMGRNLIRVGGEIVEEST